MLRTDPKMTFYERTMV